MDDQFRPIEGFPGYRVNRDGEVQSCRANGKAVSRSDAWHPRRPYRRRRGCLTVNLHQQGKKTSHYVHRLVLTAFVGPPPPGLICCHGDGNPGNNRLENLRWDTYRANEHDKLRHGTWRVGSRASSAKLTEDAVGEIRRLASAGITTADLAERYGVGRQNIRAIVTRRSWRHLP